MQDNPTSKILRFINKDGKFGIKSGSLKYLIVESKIMLLIEALSPLKEKNSKSARIGVINSLINRNLFLDKSKKYLSTYL
jgi:hypothetical protein